ncbi:MAG: excinuclease ABC subunit UvrC [Gammaproteobacteria bacterium]|nr:excinuclease ABC subunit UvrC [Gammaproteobacteria bacterium]
MTPPSTFDASAFVKTLTPRPGVYRMLDAEGNCLYVGKAKNLRRRVSSYFSRSLNRRIQLMVAQIASMEVVVTHTEAEALILENNLIKSLKPKYNILLRDDKSYPYIHLTDHPFPRLRSHRGARREGGRYFGPYPNSGSIRQTLQLMQKLFPVRQCQDSTYRNRSRPCLQYQIKRCTAPCVGLVSEAAYARDLADVVLFLEGRTSEVVQSLVTRMELAAAELEFEQAARLRDQVALLQRIQERQYVSNERGDLDILAAQCEGGQACVQLFFIRGGRNLGNKAFYPKISGGEDEPQVLSAFLAQYYLGSQAPAELLLSHQPEDLELLQQVLSEQAGHRVQLSCHPRGDRARWLQMARQNAQLALQARLARKEGVQSRFEALAQMLGLEELPQRLECFDISHTGGSKTVASCVVFDQNGPLKSDYRRFNIEGIQPGDDYAAMGQALQRRYARIKAGEGAVPDILFIDGGKGQLAQAAEVMQELGISDLLLVGVAKGADRKPGLERLFLWGDEAATILPADSPALHLIQQIRDEAHRFAISGHRKRRASAATVSVLESIAGVGPKRRQRLLKAFGGLQGVARAGVEDLSRVEGISTALAQLIYDAFHGEGDNP